MIASPAHKPKVISIVGPTAVGKTGLSVKLAKRVNGEIVSADSRQVYEGLDIGSGKVTPEEMEGVPHHLLDVADPKEVFTAADFVEKGREAIADIVKRGKVPIIVGGTGFYIDALVGRINLAEVPPNEELRTLLRSKTLAELQEMLAELDPDALERIDSKNPVRLVRAIEIATALGRVELKESDPIYQVLWIGLTLSQDELKEKIHMRLLARLNEGMLNEARQLHSRRLSYERMEELGLEYRYMARHLSGEISYDEMVEQLRTEIGKYAKRQMTWFKKNQNIHWFEPKQEKEIGQYIKEKLP